MRSLRWVCLALSLSSFGFASAIPAGAATMGVSGGHDLDALWAKARKQFDPGEHDAIVLVESRHVAVLGGGITRTKTHRVVWIGTAMGLRDHADLRVPYNSAAAKMTVTALRTWREETWWPRDGAVSETAVVETLPFAVAAADDYTSMRETMLLHDGVELPCIMETEYEIEERGVAGDGVDGLWVFAQNDPAALVELVLTVPEGVRVSHASRNGAPDPVIANGAGGTVTYAWRMTDLDRLGSPRVADPASYAPYAAWSTWPSWADLGRRIAASFDARTVMDVALADTIAARIEHAPTAASKTRIVASLVDETTRSIHYDTRHWSFSPRSASRTYETAYGHGLDRAVLAAVLFREAGLGAEPVYRSIGLRGIDEDVPGLSSFEGIAVRVTGDGIDAYYDPVEGTLADGPSPTLGRAVWSPASENAPRPAGAEGAAEASRFEIELSIEPGDDGAWKGHGFWRADGRFSPYGSMTGLEGEALALIGKTAGSVVSGAKVSGYNPELFGRNAVAVGFAFDIAASKPDAAGRAVITAADPAGGILSQLPADVHLYDERRASPVLLAGKMTQIVTVRVKTGDRKPVQIPKPSEISNPAGRFVLSTVEKDGWVTVRRELSLGAATFQAKDWPLLRALLLEETDKAGRTIFLK
jgi:hypothetical protein